MARRRYEDVAAGRLSAGDAELLRTAAKLGLRSFLPGGEGASFAPAMLVWPSKIVVSTTKKLREEGATVDDCVAYLRANAPRTEDIEGYAIVTDARVSADGASSDAVLIELASRTGGFRAMLRHASGRPSGPPEIDALFDSPLLSTPDDATLERAELALDASDAHRAMGQFPLAMLSDDDPPSLVHVDASEPPDPDADLFSLTAHLFESFDPCPYAIAYSRPGRDGARVEVEAGGDGPRAFVFTRASSGDAPPTLSLVARRPSLWKRMAPVDVPAPPPCRSR